VIEKLKRDAGQAAHRPLFGLARHPGLRKAQAAYYARRFGVKLNPDTQVVATLGSKEGFANVAQAITAPGDVVLCPNPSYPIHAFGFLMAGGVIRSVPARSRRRTSSRRSSARSAFDPEAARGRRLLSLEPDRLCRRPRFLQGPRRVREEARDLHPVRPRLCRGLFRRHNPPPSVLQVPGAIDVAVEFTSMSKTFRWPAGAWALRSATSAHRGAGAGEILSRLRRLHADPGRGDRGAERPGGLHREMRDDLQASAATCWSNRFGRAGWEIPRRGLDVRLGADPGAFRELGSIEFSSC
jgi:alanine-synthesizing transaminase